MKILTYLQNISKYIFLMLFLIIAYGNSLYSQSWVAENQQGGFILKKVVSDTTIATGQAFSYTIYFTIPAGATNVTISDNLSSSVEFLGHSVTSACGTPTVNVPTINSMGGTVSVSWANVPSGCSGSISITVAFPNGVTCNNTQIRNNVCLMGTLQNKNYEFCTPMVNTIAKATNPWKINKYPIGVAWQGGNCQYLTANDTITYQICVYKDVGTTGQLNLVNGIVRDTLPAGAVLVSSTCGATVQSGNIITWNVGNMSANSMYASSCCQFVVYYPSSIFPNGTNITNKAVLSGDLGKINPPCDNFTISSNTTCVEKKIITNANISKWVYTNRQPGCSGQYLIYICNDGTTPITINALDTLPTSLNNYSIGAVYGLNATINSGIVTINGTLQVGQCGYIYVNFQIPQNITINTTITNCVWLNKAGSPPVSTCVSFIVDAPSSKPCLWKEVCNKQTSYTPGSIIRYRLRIQNIGGMALTGATISDILNPNLEYIGNTSAYISNSWNTPCTTSPANPWSGVSVSYNPSTNTISALIDTIPSVCQNIFYNACGMYGTGGVPYYYIEMDVKVRDTAALGNIPNKFSISGGSLGTSVENSNTDYILIAGVVGYNLEKGIKKPSDPNYSSSINSSAGSTVNYKLKMNSSGTAALRHITFVDLLPKDDNTNDSKILVNCGSRASQFNISYNSLISNTPTVASYWNNTATSLANVNSWTPTGAPGNAFTTGCGIAGTWSSGAWATSQKNLGAYFGSVAVGTSGAEIEFSANIDPTASKSNTSCNSFAASGWTKHLIQSSIPTFQLAGQLESQNVCVTIDSIQNPKECLEILRSSIICGKKDPKGLQEYIMTVAANSCTPANLLINSPDGFFSTASFAFTSSPWTLSTTFTQTSTNNPITIHYTLICGGEICKDSIVVNLPKCNDEPPIDECCAKFIHKIGDTKLVVNNTTGYVGLIAPIYAGPNKIKKFSATIVNAQLKKKCKFSSSTWTRIFGDITNGNLTVSPAPGPQLLSLYSREAIWGAGECVDWNNGVNLHLDMLFPPFSGNFSCSDSLKFQVRYSFTDCECNTCDTIISYTVVRKTKLVPWTGVDNISRLLNTGLKSDEPSATSVVMENNNNGKLWIISPDDEENDVTIQGVEIRSQEVELVAISNNGKNGIIQGDVAFINLKVNKGESSAIDLKFNNNKSIMQFPINVRFLYTVKGDDNAIYTDPITYMARVPDGAGDEMGVNTDIKPENIKTYALYFQNSNAYKQTVSVISLKPSANLRVLAVGPVNAEKDQTYIVPQKQSDGSYLITTLSEGVIGVNTKEMVSPIFITILGVIEDNPIMEFSTYDENGEIISNGEFRLSNPISKVIDIQGNDDIGIKINSIMPNPASSTITITISSDKIVKGAKMGIFDSIGREVINLNNNLSLLEQGQHIFSIDINKLVNGIYFFTIQTPSGTISAPISVIR